MHENRYPDYVFDPGKAGKTLPDTGKGFLTVDKHSFLNTQKPSVRMDIGHGALVVYGNHWPKWRLQRFLLSLLLDIRFSKV